jgi:hypothetical protein
MLDSSLLGMAALVAGIFGLGGFVKGVVGFGLPTITLGLLALTRPLPEAMTLVLAPTIATNIWQALAGGQLRPTLRRLRGFLLLSGIGTLAGTALLAVVDARLLSGLLGLLLLASSLSGLFGPRWPSPTPQREAWLSPLIGAVSGAAAGLTGSYMMPAAPWLTALRLPPDQFVQGFGLGATLVTVLLSLGLAGQGMLTLGLGVASLGVLAPAFAGMSAGRLLRGRLPEAWFRRLVHGFLLLLGLQLAWRGLFCPQRPLLPAFGVSLFHALRRRAAAAAALPCAALAAAAIRRLGTGQCLVPQIARACRDPIASRPRVAEKGCKPARSGANQNPWQACRNVQGPVPSPKSPLPARRSAPAATCSSCARKSCAWRRTCCSSATAISPAAPTASWKTSAWAAPTTGCCISSAAAPASRWGSCWPSSASPSSRSAASSPRWWRKTTSCNPPAGWTAASACSR